MEFEEPEAPEPKQVANPKPLTEDNLSKLGGSKAGSAAKSQKSTKSKKSKRPAWAMTPKMEEDEKEAEIDELIEFAYDLDYEKYMEDYEVRQALAIIKDRVNEIKQDEDWKMKIADEWNQVAEQEGNDARSTAPSKKSQAPDQRSVYSYKSGASNASRMSYKKRVEDEKKSQASKAEWQSVTSSKGRTAEDRVAAKIASEVLRDNAKLRGVHSGASIQKILQREAKKQLLMETGGTYEGPVISKVVDRGQIDKTDASHLPYLNKNPAV